MATVVDNERYSVDLREGSKDGEVGVWLDTSDHFQSPGDPPSVFLTSDDVFAMVTSLTELWILLGGTMPRPKDPVDG